MQQNSILNIYQKNVNSGTRKVSDESKVTNKIFYQNGKVKYLS